MPVDDGWLRRLVAEEDVEISLASQRKPLLSVRLHESENVRRAAFDFDTSLNDSDHFCVFDCASQGSATQGGLQQRWG